MSDHIFKHIQQRCFNKPLLLEPNKARVIAGFLESRLNIGSGDMLPTVNVQSEEYEANPGGGMTFEERPVISGRIEDVVVVPIIGTLVNRSGNMDAMSGITSHRSIRNEIVAAANDRTVKAIILDIDSGGGEVEGNFDLGRLIRQVNDEIKPVVAIANGDAYSGAFSLGVSAGQFFMTETGGVGSVGVIIQHVDFSEANEAMGIKVTNIKFGEDKDMFSSDSPLSAEAKAVLQKEVNRTGELFVNHVADMRGISKESVINTEAGLIFGQEAVNINFVDGITSFDDLLEDMINADFPIGPIKSERMSEMFLNKKNAETDPAKKAEEVVNPDAPETGAEGEVEAPAETETPTEAPAEVETPETEAPAEAASVNDPVERAAQISAMCAEANMADMAPSFIRSDMTVEQLKNKIDSNTQVRQACVLAGKPDRADEFIKAGTPLSKVQSTLISEAAEDQNSNEVNSTQTPDQMNSDIEKAKEAGGNVILKDAKMRQEKANQKGAK